VVASLDDVGRWEEKGVGSAPAAWMAWLVVYSVAAFSGDRLETRTRTVGRRVPADELTRPEASAGARGAGEPSHLSAPRQPAGPTSHVQEHQVGKSLSYFIAQIPFISARRKEVINKVNMKF